MLGNPMFSRIRATDMRFARLRRETPNVKSKHVRLPKSPGLPPSLGLRYDFGFV